VVVEIDEQGEGALMQVKFEMFSWWFPVPGNSDYNSESHSKPGALRKIEEQRKMSNGRYFAGIRRALRQAESQLRNEHVKMARLLRQDCFDEKRDSYMVQAGRVEALAELIADLTLIAEKERR
jgi:hypothetical protein